MKRKLFELLKSSTISFLLKEKFDKIFHIDTKEIAEIPNSPRGSNFSGAILSSILLLCIAIVSCDNPQVNEKRDIQDFKNSPLDISFQKFLRQNGVQISNLFDNDFEQLQPGNLYTNHFYRLTIDFPNHWQIDRGPHEYSVVRAFEADSGISITLAVIPEPIKLEEGSIKNRNTMEHLNSITNGDPENFFRAQLKKQADITPEELSIKDFKIGRYQFIGPTYKIMQQFPSGTTYYMRIITLNTVLFNNAYSISYSAPEDYFNIGVLESVLNRFQVIAPLSSDKNRNESLSSDHVENAQLAPAKDNSNLPDPYFNEEFIKHIYKTGTFSTMGSFDKFKEDMMSSRALRQKVFTSLGYDTKQTFEEFEKNLGIDPDYLPPLPIYDENTVPFIVPNPGQNISALRDFYKYDDQGYLDEKKAAEILNTPGDVLTVAKANTFLIDRKLKVKTDPEFSIEALGKYMLHAKLISERSRKRLKILYQSKYNESEIDKIADTYTAFLLLGRDKDAKEFLVKYPELLNDPNIDNVFVANQRLRDVSLAEHHIYKKHPGFEKRTLTERN
jgi:hypothetical protein